MAGQPLSPKRMGARAWLELLLLSLIWGAVFMSVNVALKELGPLTIVTHRLGWACLILWIIVVSLRLNVPLTARAFVGFLGMGILNNALPFTLQAWSQLHIESGLTAILNATTAIWGVLIAAFFLADERLTWARTIGVCVGFLGVSMAVGLSNLAAFDMRSFGQISVIVSTISYAFAGVWARHFMQGIHPLVQAVGMLSVSTFIMVPLAISVEGPLEFKLSAQAWAALAYLAVIGTAGAYLLYYRVLAMAGSGNLMLCTLLIAPIAILLGALFLGEALPARTLAGFATLAVGLLIISERLPFGPLAKALSRVRPGR